MQLMCNFLPKKLTFLSKICACGYFVVLRTLPIGNNSYLAMLERIFQYSPVATFALCSPYSRHSHFFENTVGTSCNTFHYPPVSKLTMGSEIALPIDKSIFFQKKCSFSCVCAFFVVPLHAFLRLCALVYRNERVTCTRKKRKIMFNF